MFSKWIISQDGKSGARLSLALATQRNLITIAYYIGPDFESAKKQAINDLAKIHDAPLEIEEGLF